MIPFLKKKQEAAVMVPDEIKVRKPDEEEASEFGMLDAIVEDMIEAIHKRDKRLLKSALEALVGHIKEEDEMQDMAMES